MCMITTIIFDFGGVFVIGKSETFFKNASKFLSINLKEDEIDEKLWDNLMKGKISLQEFFREVFRIHIQDKRIEKLIEIWVENWKLDPDMIVFAKKLKPKYKLVMLSNADREGVKRSNNDLHFSFFDYKFLSFDLGLVKPEKEIYEHVIKELKIKPDECVFIDDKIENVEAAKNLGIHGIVFENKEQLKTDLEKLGVKVD